MTKALFKSWRDEWLKPQSEKEEVKKETNATEILSTAIPSTKKEANKAANYVDVAPSSIASVEALVTSFPFIVLTTDSKPRSVVTSQGFKKFKNQHAYIHMCFLKQNLVLKFSIKRLLFLKLVK
jgi:hypothetical protein